MSFKNFDLIQDIYYQKEYISLYLKEGESLFEFKYKQDTNKFYTIAIKRPITKIGNIPLNEGFFDLETVYGYGGFYTNTDNKQFLKEALKAYEQKCDKERIIAEFLRFHPFNDFALQNPEFFDMLIHDRNVVYVDLSLSKEQRWSEYSSNTRNILRRAAEKLTFSETNDLAPFIELYHETMKKNSAESFYFFDDNYFQKLLEFKSSNLYTIMEDQTDLSSGFFLFGEEFAHYHLSANNYTRKQHNANYLMLENLFEEAKKMGIEYFVLGGGRTNKEDDALLRFKQKFSKFTKPFYIAGKIYNKTIYDRYVKSWEQQSQKEIKYFLKYRLELP